ncbi:MAG TPA: XTP/dITP diphosphatase [Blastocatellia bacterium]|nr:XTP/dITP diphosphatase [Blastocatellia bacterium]
MQLLIATTNSGKVREAKDILALMGLQIVDLGQFPGAPVPEETGATFEENALIKARHYFRLTGVTTVADDSGLEVDILGGAPGVRSARYAGEGASDNDRIERLLRELSGAAQPDRSARFVCAAAIVWPGGEQVFRGEVRGLIATEPAGEGGFGFDPVFFYPQFGKTFAQLSRAEKSSVSHRGVAFTSLAKWISQKGLL